jgi:filamentous hemagglutinin family protein
LDRAVARLLVAALLLLTPLSAWAGDEFQDANNATYDNNVVTLDNTIAGGTTFTIDTNRTVIEWNDFQQPANNTLDFHFSDPSANSTVLNRIGASRASNVFGTLISNGTVILANPFGVYIREGAVIDVGNFVAVGANLSRRAFLDAETMVAQLTGPVWNGGYILAERNISLFGRTVTNRGIIESANGHVLAVGGETLIAYDWDAITADFLAPQTLKGILGAGRIENSGSIHARDAAFFAGSILNIGDIAVDDGTLLMVAADGIWVSEFDNPILFNIPSYDPSAHTVNSSENGEVRYAIENHGRLDAGLGHVRLAASDPLGFAIRQGTGSIEAPATIVAQQITLEADEQGLVHLSGEINADNLSDDGSGGTIDITGSMIVLKDANIHASGTLGGGTIHVGGEREGRGELRRARLVLVDEDSTVRADAIRAGDGGEVILFAEDLTSVDGELSARGGDEGGDGGFVETSGLKNFRISRTPDVTAPRGLAGEWLIDPFNITIDNSLPDADTNLNNAIFAILSPNFDPTSFDGILRSVDESVGGGPSTNFVSAELIENALSAGTSVTLSTQAFGRDSGTDAGNITIETGIIIDGNNVIAGTTARLRLLAAGDIIVNNDIMSAMMGTPSNLILTVELRANDTGQVETNQAFAISALKGSVIIDANIQTGGGDVILTGSSVFQNSGTIDTDGGGVDIRTGAIDQFGNATRITRRATDPILDNSNAPNPVLELSGVIDTSAVDAMNTGGNVTLIANSLNVRTSPGAPGDEAVVAGQLNLIGTIMSGGGNVELSGGVQIALSGANYAGSVSVTGTILSSGGDVIISANHIDPDGETGLANVSFVDNPSRQGGIINIDFAIGEEINTQGGALSIGSERTQLITLNGNFDTRDSSDSTENGIVQILALDLQSIDPGEDRFGQGEIIIGGISATTISSSAVDIQSRSVSLAGGAGLAVDLLAEGSSTATLPDLITPVAGATSVSDSLERNEIRIRGDRQITFNLNTSLQAESIEIVAASQPADLNTTVPTGGAGDERPILVSETRLTFAGTGGAVAATGVRLSADSILISVGDGTTAGDGLAVATEDVGTAMEPTDFELQRIASADYAGLQLRDTAGGERPDDIQIRQDGDLTITRIAPTAGETGVLDLAGAFDTTIIGIDGMNIVLESSDGRLTIEDAQALNNNASVSPGSDDGKSFVVLNGGLFLLDAGDPGPVGLMDDSILFRDGTATLGADGTTAFDVESLTVSSAGNLTVRQQIIDGISATNLPVELIFESGRITGASHSLGRGTLTVEEGITITSGGRLALLAGATGFGNLVFEDASAATTTLEANELELRAGGGSDSQNSVVDERSRIVGLQTNVAIRDVGSAIFGDATSTATSFSYRQDAAIDGQADLPDLADFGLVGGEFRSDGDVAYRVRSDEGTIDLNDDDPMIVLNEGARFKNANLSLIGVDAIGAPAIDVSSDFLFEGKRVEVGGIGNFAFTQSLAAAFNRSGLDDEEELTIRAGASGIGDLRFSFGSQSSVLVKASRVNLIAGEGAPLDENDVLLGGSAINTSGAEFDLAGPLSTSTSVFTMTTTSILTASDLPDGSQFTGGILPDILALRSNLGLIEFQDFDVTTLPLDLIDLPGEAPGRLILEAFEVTLSQTDGDDLDLTNVSGLNLRIRANNLTFIASNNQLELAGPAQVHLDTRVGDDPTGGLRTDASFDGESLLIEGFDSDVTSVSIENLSALSQDTDGTGFINLANSRGPTSITIAQDGAITPGDLFDRDAVAGQLTRSIDDDDDENAVSTDRKSVV